MDTVVNLTKSPQFWLISALTAVLLVFIMVAAGSMFYFAIPAIGLAALGVAISIRYPKLLVLFIFVSAAALFENPEGMTLQGGMHYALSVLAFTLGVIPLAITNKLPARTPVDYSILLLIGFVVYGVALGFVVGDETTRTIAEIAYFAPLLPFFLYRYFFADLQFQKLFGIALLFMGIAVLAINLYNYQALLAEAVLDWQYQLARVPRNEVMLLLGCSFFIAAIGVTRQFYLKVIMIGMLGIFLVGLVLTHSRGYYLALLTSAFAMFLIADRRTKWHLILTGLVMIGSAVFIAMIFFADLFSVVYNAMIDRINLAQFGQLDRSLQERVIETQTVWEKIVANPIAGYGLGTTYLRYSIIQGIHHASSYIHNGYLAVWFKFGFFGFAAFMFLLYALLKQCRAIYHNSTQKPVKAFALSGFGTVAGMMVVNITSPQFLAFTNMLVFVIIAVFASHYYDQLRKSGGTPDEDGQELSS